MRYFALILSAGIALSTIPVAAAVSCDTPTEAMVVAYGCPLYEGYPDCHPDTDVGGFMPLPSPRVTMGGPERRPLHRKVSPSLAATARLRLPQ
jgi:hypothetical protein